MKITGEIPCSGYDSISVLHLSLSMQVHITDGEWNTPRLPMMINSGIHTCIEVMSIMSGMNTDNSKLFIERGRASDCQQLMVSLDCFIFSKHLIWYHANMSSSYIPHLTTSHLTLNHQTTLLQRQKCCQSHVCQIYACLFHPLWGISLSLYHFLADFRVVSHEGIYILAVGTS